MALAFGDAASIVTVMKSMEETEAVVDAPQQQASRRPNVIICFVPPIGPVAQLVRALP